MYIVDVYLGIIIGTSLVYDIYFGVIPNYVLIAGYAGIVPVMYGISGWAGIGQLAAGTVIFTAGLFLIYLLGGIGAGDVKLLALECSALGIKTGIRFLTVVFVTGAVMGIVKLLLKLSDVLVNRRGSNWKRTGIRFTIPVFAGYLIMLLSKGGIE